MKLTVHGWNVHKAQTGESLHVLVDGYDASGRCEFADDEDGYAVCFKLNSQGARYKCGLDPAVPCTCSGHDKDRQPHVAKEILRGKVEIVAGEPW